MEEYFKIEELLNFLAIRTKEDEFENHTQNYNREIKNKINLMEEAQEFGEQQIIKNVEKTIKYFESLNGGEWNFPKGFIELIKELEVKER